MSSVAPARMAPVKDRPLEFGAPTAGRRHPVVALAMVLPLALTLAFVFGGVQAVMTQASSVAGVMGR